MPQADDALHDFASLLAHMGWPVERAAKGSCSGAPWRALTMPDCGVLVVAAAPDAPPDPAEAFKRYEDQSPWHRDWSAKLAGHGLSFRYLVLLHGRSAHLVDAADGQVLVAAQGESERDEALAPLLDPRRLAGAPRPMFPGKTHARMAAELRAWVEIWSARLGGRLALGPDPARGFFEALMLERRARELGPALFRGPGGEDRAAAPPRNAAQLEARFRELQEAWNLLQQPGWRALGGIAKEAERTGLLRPLLESLALLARSKFSAAQFADAFADEELRILSYRGALEDAAARAVDGDEWLYREDEVDLDAAGCVVLLRRVEQLAARTAEWARETASAAERGLRPGCQLDLLAEAPDPPDRGEAAHFVLRRLLRARTADARRAGLARLLLLCAAMESSAASGGAARPWPAAKVRCDPAPARKAPADPAAAFLVN